MGVIEVELDRQAEPEIYDVVLVTSKDEHVTTDRRVSLARGKELADSLVSVRGAVSVLVVIGEAVVYERHAPPKPPRARRAPKRKRPREAAER